MKRFSKYSFILLSAVSGSRHSSITIQNTTKNQVLVRHKTEELVVGGMTQERIIQSEKPEYVQFNYFITSPIRPVDD